MGGVGGGGGGGGWMGVTGVATPLLDFKSKREK